MNFVPLLQLLILSLSPLSVARADDVALGAGETRVPIKFAGGHETEPVDRVRPVILVASALGVPPAVFREAFNHVRPATAGSQPQPADVQHNKRELLSRLAKYGVTNERLDEVSDYYRYRPGFHSLWRHAEAAGFAIVRGDKVVRVQITEPGAGYTTPPMVSVPGIGLTQYLVARLEFSTDLARNGSVETILLSALGDNNFTMKMHLPGVIEVQPTKPDEARSADGSPSSQPSPSPPR